jgi:hypothetical protein
MATTTNYGWEIPDDTDLVKDGAAAMRELGQDIDTTLYGLGRIGQVVQTVKTDTFSMSSSTFADVTGLSVTITPTKNTSKILVLLDGKFSATDADVVTVQTRLMRNSTAIYIGDTASNRIRTTFAGAVFAQGSNIGYGGGIFLDSPATTSATTYKLQIATSNNTKNVHVNRSNSDLDQATYARTASSITVMEVLV